MRKKILLVFLLFPLLFGGHVCGQELLRTVVPVDFTITPTQFSDKNPDKQIFRSLALNNGLSIHQVKIKFQANVFISIQRDSINEQQTLSAKILNKKISGDTRFRDFAIDSLLMPTVIYGKINLRRAKDTLTSFALELRTSNTATTTILPDDLLINTDSISAGFTIERVSYRGWDWAFNEVSNLINLYYAYNEILKELIDEYDAVALKQEKGDVDLFIAWHHISRVNNYIQRFNFSKKLNLEKADPEGFLKRYSTSKRMERRASTLFQQIIKKNKKGNLADKRKYCAAYAQLSQQYLDRAHNLQPYLASGFEEVALIFPTQKEKNNLIALVAFYDVFNRIDEASTPQLIYSHFIDFAKQAYDRSQFVVSLQMLKNALQMAEWFDDVVVSDTYTQLYNQSLDGVMTSYLKVSIIAYRVGKFEMADQYYQKASLIYEEFGHLTYSIDTAGPAFLQFTEKQVELSRDLLDDGEIYKALSLLKQARQIRDCKSVNDDCPEIDSLIAQCLRGRFQQKMDTVDQWIIQEDYDSAWRALNQLKRFTDRQKEYFNPFPNGDFAQRAVLLFGVFFSRGEALLVGKYPEKALSWFLKAQQIERDYLPDQQDTRLKLLVYNATVPVILKEIEKADFETWANHMEIADSIYRHAKQLQHDYQQENNEELIAAFLRLESKMKQRTCIDYGMRVQNLNTIIVNRVKSGKFDAAAVFLHEAKMILDKQQHCGIDASETRELEKKYARLFAYQLQLKKVEAWVSNENYDSAIVQFVGLSRFYSKYGLEKFGVEKSSLFIFIKEKGKPGLTREAVKYYIQIEEYMEALQYLDVLKKQQVPSGETRKLQQLVGRGIGYSASTDAEVQKYTEGEGWYIYFRLARLTTKIRKKTD